MESSHFTLDEGSVNWWTKSDASCDFFKIKVLLQHQHAHFFIIVYGYFYTTVSALTRCD